MTSVADRGFIPEDVLAERLLLGIYAYGTNTGIRSVAGGDHGHSEEDIRYVRRRYVRRRYLTAEAARQIGIEIANATFQVRSASVWGEGSTAVASDSTHFGSWDQNIFTEWHSRYSGRAVLIYWSVEKGSVVIHSKRINCSASAVHAMVEGAVRHGTEMTVESNYVDSHGQSEIGFGVTKLLGFDLLPRIKRINKCKLYRPAAGEADLWPELRPALTRPIRWELIAQQYDQMVKYATAIRTGTASTEAILRRFMKANANHPTYQAMIELGRAQNTIFLSVTWNPTVGQMISHGSDHELRRCIGRHGGAGEVAGPGPARTSGRMVAGVDRSRAGTAHDRRLRLRARRVSGRVRVGRRRLCHGEPRTYRRLRA
ncbi:transposase [Nocardia sp. NBC_00881]|uniref:Tn3 family transposase n=1 Tax=Nocardia sp. NBC_00881 TaxID=2975995 RepID=UPI00386B7998|nr:transposase [Nocardia sp. NBC_00881]